MGVFYDNPIWELKSDTWTWSPSEERTLERLAEEQIPSTAQSEPAGA